MKNGWLVALHGLELTQRVSFPLRTRKILDRPGQHEMLRPLKQMFCKTWRLGCVARWSMTANKPLVPTRNGEAPLLAAQRRRYAVKGGRHER